MTLAVLLARMSRTLAPWTYRHMVAVASAKGVACALADGRIVRLLPDCYTVRMHARSFSSRALAGLAWAGPNAVLAGTSALYWWGAADVPHQVFIAAPWSERPRAPEWLRIRRFLNMPEAVEFRGARTVHPDVAVVTAHSQLPTGQRAEALYRPLRMGLVSAVSVGHAASSLARVRGRRELEARLGHAMNGAESHLEEAADRQILRGPLLEGLVRQHVIEADGATYRLDAFDPRSLTAIEFDGHASHGSREAQRRDKVRDARLAALGIQTLRFTFEDSTGRPDWCRRVSEETVLRRRQSGALDVPQGASGTSEEW